MTFWEHNNLFIVYFEGFTGVKNPMNDLQYDLAPESALHERFSARPRSSDEDLRAAFSGLFTARFLHSLSGQTSLLEVKKQIPGGGYALDWLAVLPEHARFAI